jgi:hypothetical protein
MLEKHNEWIKTCPQFRDLVVYQRAFKVAKTIFEISKTFPKEETYSLTDY